MSATNSIAALNDSHERVCAAVAAGRISAESLITLADAEANLALSLQAVPRDPVKHVRDVHAHAKRALQLAFDANPVAKVRSGSGFEFTLRKSLRRVHDHALDHLNQIEQWLAWQHRGAPPMPTDGWVGSRVTLNDDLAPLTQQELDAWQWRIDLAAHLLVLRAESLVEAELDWQPPDGGWTLRKSLHHVATGAIAYTIWFGSPLPDDAPARYAEAHRRVVAHVRHLTDSPLQDDALLFDDDIEPLTVGTAIAYVLKLETDMALAT